VNKATDKKAITAHDWLRADEELRRAAVKGLAQAPAPAHTPVMEPVSVQGVQTKTHHPLCLASRRKERPGMALTCTCHLHKSHTE